MHSSQALPHRFPNALLLPALVSAALLLGACSKTEAPPKAGGAMPVTVLEMQPRSVPNAVEIVAQTEGAKETEVRARVGGILMKQL
ncbi:MAG TPA: efflux transporter periplasmic adaptor subunit, partial [Azonexus sp.]|nr:efflux transporter periplasmic adaptor subunit [Azonexus sp.]